MGPYFIGWVWFILLTGMTIPPATQLLSKNSTLRKPENYVLIITLVFNAIVSVITIADILLWGTYQKRDEDSIEAFMIPDALWPLPAGVVAFVVQGFFAHRAWKVGRDGKNRHELC